MHPNPDDRSEATAIDPPETAFDALVGICLSPDEGVTDWTRSAGDVIGYLLGRTSAGWLVIAEHVSSDPWWSRTDIARYHLEHDPTERLPYEWVGWRKHAFLRENYPPAVSPLSSSEATTDDGAPS